MSKTPGIDNPAYFRTSDILLGSFLMINKFELLGIEIAEESTSRCNFVFSVKATDKRLKDTVFQWYNSSEAQTLKEVLYANKLLKKAIREFLEQRNSQDEYEPDHLGF